MSGNPPRVCKGAGVLYCLQLCGAAAEAVTCDEMKQTCIILVHSDYMYSRYFGAQHNENMQMFCELGEQKPKIFL